ncbi:uncharacterized protein UTRI_00299_B [Ustilago trichophora]|uniref:RRM domain-containing protein n=1 Tax=Ustilago trichophora TaxID=86804 RepID=A0A5C3DQS4_9BASI|nr:uncharacterized protein UTRI_00299_B [Ustilago trichophora]
MKGGRERAQRNLYVLNLPLDATTDQFEALFAQYGSVEHAVILATLDHLARRRGFILMSDPAQARAAIENLNGHVWHHYRIEVSFAIVQRSGTPFSQEAADSLREESASIAKPTGSIGQSFDPKLAADMSTDPGQEALQARQRRDDATLVLSGLDSSVITSPAMLRALTDPFGHVEALYHSEQQHDGPHDITRDGRAVIVYCCSSSAALARLALHGLFIGKSRVQASLAAPASTAAENFHETGYSDATPLPAYLHGSPRNPALGIVSSHPREPPTARMTPRQFNASSRYPGFAGPSSSSPTQQHSTRGCGAHPDPWRNRDTSSEETKHNLEDLVLNERRNLPRPIGDERQRAASKR